MFFTTSLLLLTLGQYDYDQQQFQNQQYRYEAQQQAQQANFAAQNQLRALTYKTQLDALKLQPSSSTNAKKQNQKKAAVQCRDVALGALRPLGGRYDEQLDLLTVFLEEEGGALLTFRAQFDGPSRNRVTHAWIALESSSGLQFVSIGWKQVTAGHSGTGDARRFKATFSGVTVHDAVGFFQPSPVPRDCLVIDRVSIDAPWYE